MRPYRNRMSRVEAKVMVTIIRVNKLVNRKGKTRTVTRKKGIARQPEISLVELEEE